MTAIHQSFPQGMSLGAFRHPSPFDSKPLEKDVDEFLAPYINSSLLEPSVGPSMSRQQSNATSISTPITPALDTEDLQTHAKPSHNYSLYKQQTGLAPGSIAGLRQPVNPNLSSFSSSGLDSWTLDSPDNTFNTPSFGEPFFGYDPSTGAMDMDMSGSDILSQNDMTANAYINPDSLMRTPTNPPRYYPGMHEEMARKREQEKLEHQKLLQQRQQQHQQQQPQRQFLQSQQQQQQKPLQDHPQQQLPRQMPLPQLSNTMQPPPLPQGNKRGDPNTATGSNLVITEKQENETIARVLNQLRTNAQAATSANAQSQQNPLPSVVRARKEEEDMDDDEKLLASDKGKQLTSKQRRQLRNKVSARNFRSRRKEYIQTLEMTVSERQRHVEELTREKTALREENERYRCLIEHMLSHQAFQPFVEDLSKHPAVSQRNAILPQPVMSWENPLAEFHDISPLGMTPSETSLNSIAELNSGMSPWTQLDPQNFKPSVSADGYSPSIPAGLSQEDLM